MKVEYSKEFIKSVRKLSGKILESVRKTIQEVIDAPSIEYITNCKKLTNYKSVYHIRIGDYRAFFIFQITNNVVIFEYLYSEGRLIQKRAKKTYAEKIAESPSNRSSI